MTDVCYDKTNRNKCQSEPYDDGTKGRFAREGIRGPGAGQSAAVFGIVLVGVVSFEAGFLTGVARSSQPLVVNVPVEASVSGGQVAGSSTEAVPSDAAAKGVPDRSGCAFIGSRNSTLYHLPSCAVAKRIKPENVVCFASAEDAQSKGYRAGCVK